MDLKYKAYLFDLDDTLLDFHSVEEIAFYNTIKKFGITNTNPEYYSFYKQENLKLWRLHEEGKVDKSTIRFDRFDIVLKKFDWDFSIDEASEYFMNELPKISRLKPYALDVLKKLQGHAEVAVVTNGFSTFQHSRLAKAGLTDLVKFMVCSDDVNSAKPKPEIFDHAFSKMENKKEDTLFIGDRPTSDILGAVNYGMDSCWYNPHKDDYPEGFTARATYEAVCLTEILDL